MPEPTDAPQPVNEAERRLKYLLQAAGFEEGKREHRIILDRAIGSTTPDVFYRAGHHDEDEGVCIYLDGLSDHLHGNPETEEKDRRIRDWLRNNGYEVIEISVNQLDDADAMTRHFRQLVGYLREDRLRETLRQARDWFRRAGEEGQCNTKGALFLALCRASGIPGRMHFSLIKKEIQRGLFTGIGYLLMPPLISHSWLEVEIEGKWRRLDAYINDEAFFTAAKLALREKGWETGYSISCTKGEPSADFYIDDEQFVQMGAVVADHGVWDDPSDYYRTDNYQNRPCKIKLLLYRLMIKRINHRVALLRSSPS
jgi:hypothetical protein